MRITKEKLDEPKYAYILRLSERELREVLRAMRLGMEPSCLQPLCLRELYNTLVAECEEVL